MTKVRRFKIPVKYIGIGEKIDDLQTVIAFLKGQDYGVELQFSNFRS